MIGLSKIGRICRISMNCTDFFPKPFKMSFSRGKGIVNSIRESSKSPVSSPLSSRTCFEFLFMELAIKTRPVRREGSTNEMPVNYRPGLNEIERKIGKLGLGIDNGSFRHSLGGSRNILFQENRVDEKARMEMSRLSFVLNSV